MDEEPIVLQQVESSQWIFRRKRLAKPWLSMAVTCATADSVERLTYSFGLLSRNSIACDSDIPEGT